MTTRAKARTFETRNDMPEKTRAAMIELLNQHLAEVFDLYSQTKQAHWNVKGKDFFQLHELFDKLAESLEEHSDIIAERATALGGRACGTVRMAASATTLPEYPADITDGMAHVEALAERYGAYGARARAAIDAATEADDMGTADLFTDVSRDIDKHLWFIEAHLQG